MSVFFIQNRVFPPPKRKNGDVAKCNVPVRNMQGQFLSLHISFQLYAKGAPRSPPRRGRPPFVGVPTFPPPSGGIGLSHYPRQEIATLLHIIPFCNRSVYGKQEKRTETTGFSMVSPLCISQTILRDPLQNRVDSGYFLISSM